MSRSGQTLPRTTMATAPTCGCIGVPSPPVGHLSTCPISAPTRDPGMKAPRTRRRAMRTTTMAASCTTRLAPGTTRSRPRRSASSGTACVSRAVTSGTSSTCTTASTAPSLAAPLWRQPRLQPQCRQRQHLHRRLRHRHQPRHPRYPQLVLADLSGARCLIVASGQTFLATSLTGLARAAEPRPAALAQALRPQGRTTCTLKPRALGHQGTRPCCSPCRSSSRPLRTRHSASSIACTGRPSACCEWRSFRQGQPRPTLFGSRVGTRGARGRRPPSASPPTAAW
mmetsp:Transcript_74103/g.209835  ORF Transcript_74103/g.209835 Transcript_74103/m.209835 type:complete len:283 (-) Transcript_74103:2233-3081(-)